MSTKATDVEAITGDLDPAKVRAWAIDRDYAGPRGRLPADVLEAYLHAQATPQAPAAPPRASYHHNHPHR